MNTSPLRLIAILSFLMGASQLHAGASNKSGNPYGNGTFFNTAGTFNGVLRGVDIVGVTQFTTAGSNASSNTIISGGPLYIYNATTGLYDDSWGVYPTLDPSANTLTAFMASTNAAGYGGTFSANLKTVPPNQTYNGQGSINLTGVPQQFTINGCRIAN